MDQDLQIDFELLEKIEVTLSSIAFLSFLTNIIGRLIQIQNKHGSLGKPIFMQIQSRWVRPRACI